MLIFILAFLVILFASLILYARWNYGVLEGMGIPVHKPHFLLGSTWDSHREVGVDEDIKRFKKYGSVYGVYEGREPQVHICDADIIKSIFIKDFEHFNARRPFDFGSPFLNEMVGFVPDAAKWKFLRGIMSPTLTPAKIKGMSIAMRETLSDFTEDWKTQIKNNGGESIHRDVKQAIFTMLIDMMCRCLFSIKVQNANDPNNYFTQVVKRMFEGGSEDLDAASRSKNAPKPNIMFPLSLSFPFLKWFSPPIFNPKAAEEFRTTFKDLVRKRRGGNLGTETTHMDYVYTVMNWLDQLQSSEFKKANVTEQTILCQALAVFFGGQDQISSILPYLFRQAAQNPSIESRILEELDGFLNRHFGQIEYENLHELPYLLACVNEAMRFITFFTRAERVCIKDWEGHGLKIRKGMTVIVPIFAANQNPKYFPEPEAFNPERFLPENKSALHPCALHSFGHGPRNCLGIRLAYDMMLFTAAYIYKDFRFSSNNMTKIEILPGSIIMAHTNGIFLDVMTRN